jgi:APA family basic amino acid/polyamine antiporter
LPAFLIRACLLLEYGVSASAIAVGWGQYLNELLSDTVGWRLPAAIANPPGAGDRQPARGVPGGDVFDPAAAGPESVLANTVLVFAKLLVLALFVGIALMHFNPGHFTPFAPKGMAGIGTAASSIFFSYIGIDTVATAGDEVENPAAICRWRSSCRCAS